MLFPEPPLETSAPSANGGPNLTRRNLLYGLAMMGTAALAYAREPKQVYPTYSEAVFATLFPKQVGAWIAVSNEGLILPPPDELSKKLYQNLLTRLYTDDAAGREVMMLLAYANRQEGNIQAHRPDICYPAAGFDLVENRITRLRLDDGRMLPGRTIVATRSNRVETLFYWVRVDRDFPLQWRDQRLNMALANIQGTVPDGLIARASIIGEGPEAEAILYSFVKAFIADSSPRGQRILLGRATDKIALAHR